MDFSAHLPTIHLMTSVIFALQALVIAFQLPLGRRYRGIGAFFVSALLLAVGSGLLLADGIRPQGAFGPPGDGPPASGGQPLAGGPGIPREGIPWVFLWSSTLTLAGTAVQYLALAGFLGRRPSRLLLTVVVAGAGTLWAFLGLSPGTLPAVPAREAMAAPLLLAIAVLLATTEVRGFRLGAVVTGLTFLGYGLLSVYRVVRGLVDPTQMQPGPSLANDLDAVLLFGLSVLWTSGFLLMVNQRLQTDLAALASTDPLTGCLNRREMQRQLDAEVTRYRRYGRPFSLVLLDLDRFKAINDTRGHEAGDRVLVGTAQALREGLRAGDSLSRWGGEEFLILLPETGEADAAELAERLRLKIAGHAFDLEGVDVTFSAGVACSGPNQTGDSLCALADQALYRAKETRNRVVVAGS